MSSRIESKGPLERGPLVHRGLCAECAEPIDRKPWFTCGVCGASVCEDCRKDHIMHCFAKTWGLMEEKDGEWVPVDRPRQFAIK